MVKANAQACTISGLSHFKISGFSNPEEEKHPKLIIFQRSAPRSVIAFVTEMNRRSLDGIAGYCAAFPRSRITISKIIAHAQDILLRGRLAASNIF